MFSRFNPFSRRSAQESNGTVDVGDRFYKPGQHGSIWTVIRVFKPTSNALTHVVLERDGENPETYVIALNSLTNSHMFHRDERDPDSVNMAGRQRRSSDHIKDEHISEGAPDSQDGSDSSDTEPAPEAVEKAQSWSA